MPVEKEEGEGGKAKNVDEEEDSVINCEYCGKNLPSRLMDDHLYSVHGVAV